MKARAGDVYTVFNNYLGRYTACQVAYIAPPDAVSQQPGAGILSLDWVDDRGGIAESTYAPTREPL